MYNYTPQKRSSYEPQGQYTPQNSGGYSGVQGAQGAHNPQGAYGMASGQAPQGAPPVGAANYGFSLDPRAALGLQMGQSALAQGTQMMELNLKPYLGSSSELKQLFKVSNSYVLHKIGLIVFPFRHSGWLRLIQMGQSGQGERFEVPSNDLNLPDLYLPLMSFITYILLCAISQGAKGEFHPQTFGYTSSMVLGYQLLDMVVLKLGLYLMAVELLFWDLLCFLNYKFIPLVLVLTLDAFVALWTGKMAVFAYLGFAFAFFLLRLLKNVFLGNGINGMNTVTQKQRQKRIYLLFAYSYPVQFILMWLLL